MEISLFPVRRREAERVRTLSWKHRVELLAKGFYREQTYNRCFKMSNQPCTVLRCKRYRTLRYRIYPSGLCSENVSTFPNETNKDIIFLSVVKRGAHFVNSQQPCVHVNNRFGAVELDGVSASVNNRGVDRVTLTRDEPSANQSSFMGMYSYDGKKYRPSRVSRETAKRLRTWRTALPSYQLPDCL